MSNAVVVAVVEEENELAAGTVTAAVAAGASEWGSKTPPRYEFHWLRTLFTTGVSSLLRLSCLSSDFARARTQELVAVAYGV